MNKNGTIRLLFQRSQEQDQEALQVLIWARWGSMGKTETKLFEKISEIGIEEFPDVWKKVLQGSPKTITR